MLMLLLMLVAFAKEIVTKEIQCREATVKCVNKPLLIKVTDNIQPNVKAAAATQDFQLCKQL